jgi:hypothetical protein
MMMRAGLSYTDWRLMAHFQRRDWLARHTVETHNIARSLEKADGLSAILSVVLRRIMGF